MNAESCNGKVAASPHEQALNRKRCEQNKDLSFVTQIGIVSNVENADAHARLRSSDACGFYTPSDDEWRGARSLSRRERCGLLVAGGLEPATLFDEDACAAAWELAPQGTDAGKFVGNGRLRP